MSITTRAAVIWKPNEQWDVVELELDEPKAHEVLIRFEASGLCHSDDHLRAGDMIGSYYPMVGGHEGAGIVELVGDGVTRVAVGDRVVCSFIPACGTCRWCSTGHQNLCNSGRNASNGMLLDDSYRFHHGGVDVGGLCALGTFSERSVVNEYSCIKLEDHIPFEVAALVGCGVPTGWGAAVYAAGVRPGQTVVIYGSGGVGINAVQGAAYAGARFVVVVDPVEFKRKKALEFGATDVFADHDEARDFVNRATWGDMADHVIITVALNTSTITNNAMSMVGKVGSLNVVSMEDLSGPQLSASTKTLRGYQQRIQGVLFGNCNPLFDVPRLLRLYSEGQLKLDELITKRYELEQVNEASRDMLEGRNIRGVIVHRH
jgi:alcohol dehydrogenase (nicotinoprotein)